MLITSPTLAQDNRPYSIQGHGAHTCAEFAQEYAKDIISEVYHFIWAQGFMSAINQMQLMENKPSRNLYSDIDDQKSFLRHYCNENPLEEYYKAVAKLYISLPIEKIQK